VAHFADTKNDLLLINLAFSLRLYMLGGMDSLAGPGCALFIGRALFGCSAFIPALRYSLILGFDILALERLAYRVGYALLL
jgi:hypothetical protein